MIRSPRPAPPPSLICGTLIEPCCFYCLPSEDWARTPSHVRGLTAGASAPTCPHCECQPAGYLIAVPFTRRGVAPVTRQVANLRALGWN